MKKIIFLIMLFSLECYAQNKLLGILPLKDGKVNYTSVIEVERNSKEELYNRAKHWLLNYGECNDEIIFTSDKYDEISGKYSFKELWGPNDYPELYVDVLQSIKFQLRNGRYQYTITNFVVKKQGMVSQLEIYKMNNKKYTKYNKTFYNRIDAQINKIIISIEKSMAINVPVTK